MAVDRTRGRRLGVSILLAIAGAVLAVVLSIPVLLAPLDPLFAFVAAVVASELGFAVAALGFVGLAGVGLEYLRLRVPDRLAVGLVVGGTVGLFALRFGALVLVQLLGLPIAGNSITEFPDVDVGTILLALIPLSVLVIGPAEELLFRGVIQRHLAGGFSEWGAIAWTGVLFALVHVPTTAVADPNPVGVAVTLVVLFAVSVGLSALYVWSENLVVPILVHGLYDAAIFALAYVALEAG